ncbi:right-handed parallel beta-helix repeat-containing protein [Cohnella hongkongensis]|uniref:Right-handed parallel beta-helix repeat-containing protein n=1 Tax=Cohnella hongkongensis TaxID=178337 RepID=A0ABV9FFW2_9BACL
MVSQSVGGLVLAAMLVLGSIPASPEPAAAANATYYVAVTGSDSNPGTSAEPFRTIQQAADVMQPGDTAVIRAGTYRETVTPASSGAEGAPITFRAEAGATVVVSGTEPLGGWTQHAGNVYKAALAPLQNLGHENQLFVGSGGTAAPLWEARWPNVDAYSLPGLRDGMAVMDAGSAAGTEIVDGDLTQPDGFWDGATVWVRGGHGYLAQTTTVEDYDAASHTLHLAPIPDNADYLYPTAGNDYYLSGVLGALDAPGEWHIDAAAGTVYVWAPGGGIPSDVEIKQRTTAFDLSGKSHIRLEGIGTFAATIWMDDSHHNVLDGIRVLYPYFSDFSQGYYPGHQDNSGINLSGDGNELRNSTVAYSSGTLVKVNGSHNRVVNNEIHDGDYMGSYASLVVLESGEQNLISHNTLRDAGRASIYWKRGSANVQYNDIYNGMWLSRDGGMIYTYGADLGNSEIHHNRIHGNHAYSSGFNLYLDNFTENAVVHHNVIYGGDTGIVLNTPGNFKLIYNNTVVNNGQSFSYWGEEPYGAELYGTRIFNNIFTDAASFTPDTVVGNNVTDAAGIGFADPGAGDYRLTAGSTAVNAGAMVPGITDGFAGVAPDAGAYEYGGADWTAGHDFANPPDPAFVPVNTPYMNLLRNSGFELGLAQWGNSSTGTTIGVDGSTGWAKRGLFQKLRLGGGADGVAQTVTGLKPNTGYKLVGWLHNDAGEAVNIGVKEYGGEERSAYSDDTEYVRREVDFTTGPTQTSALVYVYKSSAGPGYSYADDLGLIETTPFDGGDGQALKEVALEASAFVYTIRDRGSLSLVGTLNDGTAADLFAADSIAITSSDSGVVRIDRVDGTTAQLTAIGAGQATITATVTLDGRTKAAARTVTVFPKQTNGAVQGWKADAYGEHARGFALKEDGKLSLIGQGDNVWASADDFVFLNRKVKAKANETVTLTATIDAFHTKDPNAAIGLMLRDDDAVDAKHVHFRADGLGALRYAYRNEESIQHPENYWGSQSGVLMIFDKSVTFPAKLKLVMAGQTVTGYYETADGWQEMGTVACEYTGKHLLAGVGLYSGTGSAPVKAVISDLKVEAGVE